MKRARSYAVDYPIGYNIVYESIKMYRIRLYELSDSDAGQL